MGAIFNGSGRTYYILEHKTSSKYHSAGESQKIIIDQIEIGRDSSCQVRFDESFETVSRKHCAIVRDGQNWQLVHLSSSNPTLVNGRPIQGSYYLQTGDEIQLSVGGPRLGFIVPQGAQSLTSSIKLTERMNLFRQQALAPYKRALWAMACLLLLVIIGFGAWNYKLTQDNKELLAQTEQLIKQDLEYGKQIENLEAQLKNNPENADLKKQIENLKKQRAQGRSTFTKIVQDNPDQQKKIAELERRIAAMMGDNITKVSDIIDDSKYDPEPIPEPQPIPDAKNDIRSYYGSIYRIIVEDITIEGTDGHSYKSNLPTSKIDCGAGFVTPNGNFVTARQNVQPWIFVDNRTPADSWRRRLALLWALGNDINIKYSAYSTNGQSEKIEFSTRDFDMPTGGDLVSMSMTITEEDILYLDGIGMIYERKRLKKEGINIKHASTSARAYAIFHNTGKEGVPIDAGASNSIAGGVSLDIVFYNSSNVGNLEGSAIYRSYNTEQTDTRNGTIRLQDGPGSTAFGAPVFMTESDGSKRVIGMYVGSRLVVPISRLQ